MSIVYVPWATRELFFKYPVVKNVKMFMIRVDVAGGPPNSDES